MSSDHHDQNKISYNPYYSFHQEDHTMLSSSSSDQGFAFPIITDHNYNPFIYHHQQQQQQDQEHHQPPLQNPSTQEFDHHHSNISFSNCLEAGAVEYNTLSNAFDLSCSSSEVAIYSNKNSNNNSNEVIVASAAEIPLTPNSSASFSSPEFAGVEEHSSKIKKDEGDGKSKKVKAKTKEEKKQRDPRYAFMTKSDVDNLEDGYRWRKYGQKAVKNSPFPRSYYRCTTQKCSVKKRIERSLEDPSVVITTYEGQHNHHSPATIRGGAAAMLAPSLFSAPPAFPGSFFTQELFFPNISTTTHQNYANASNYNYTQLIHPQLQQEQPQLLPDLQYDFFFPPQTTAMKDQN